MNALETLISALTPDDVMIVYSGRDHACCCGCSGSYWTHSAHRSAADAYRGYPHDDEEINDKRVARILGVFKKNLPNVEVTAADHFSLVVGKRLYMMVLPEARR